MQARRQQLLWSRSARVLTLGETPCWWEEAFGVPRRKSRLKVQADAATPGSWCMEGERVKGRDSSFATRMFKLPPGFSEDNLSTNE